MSQPALQYALESIPSCFEGIIPSSICTVAPDGTPNLTYLSVVTRIDESHVALSRQFFKKTEENANLNPLAQIQVVEPETGRQFQLDLEYERTETKGPLFERMKMKLDAVAAWEGMDQVFNLRGTDVCRVLSCELVPCRTPDVGGRRSIGLERVEAISQRISQAEDLDDVFTIALDACLNELGYAHAFVMLADESGDRLYTVGSAGFAAPGTGSEVRIGDGIIGLAASRRTTVRLTNLGRDLHYSTATRAVVGQPAKSLERTIPLPSIAASQSQLIVPMLAHRKLVGVVCLQSHEVGAFQAEDECVVGILATQIAMAMAFLGSAERPPTPGPEASPAPPAAPGNTVQVKFYNEDNTVFIDNEYLIKGVAGGIFWRLLKSYQDERRSEFSNKEIRLDQTLDLPDIKDNLEARLILLRKRLDERKGAIRIE
ncbi:MAG: GAF domain-containing protein, partial [bacterium]